ncbi:MAG: hypothetical protein RIE08_07415 [Acidimicrobiales bacterium]
MKKATVVVAVTALLAVMIGAAGAQGDTGTADRDAPATATFEGHEFDMTGDWGEARHCVVDAQGSAECFRTRTEAAELDGGPTDEDLEILRRSLTDVGDEGAAGAAGAVGEAEAAVGRALGGGVAAASGGCTLTLFANSYFGGSSVSFSSTGITYSLASYGFDQRASSWTEPGACSARFYDVKSGGSYIGVAGPFSAGGDCCLWNNYWNTGGTIDNDISYARMT